VTPTKAVVLKDRQVGELIEVLMPANSEP